MKRNLKRIMGIVLVLIALCNHCYADGIIRTTSEIFFDGYLPIAWLGIIIIGIIFFIVSIISFYRLKIRAKKDSNVNVEENEKK